MMLETENNYASVDGSVLFSELNWDDFKDRYLTPAFEASFSLNKVDKIGLSFFPRILKTIEEFEKIYWKGLVDE